MEKMKISRQLKYYLLFYVVIVVFSINGCANKSKNHLELDVGIITGGIYSNTFFAFTFPLPNGDEWIIENNAKLVGIIDSGINLKSFINNKDKTILLKIVNINNDSRLVIEGEKISKPIIDRLENVEEYLHGLMETIKKGYPGKEMFEKYSNLTVDGKTFTQVDCIFPRSSGLEIKTSLLAVIIKNAIFSICLAGKTENDKRMLTDMVKKIRFNSK